MTTVWKGFYVIEGIDGAGKSTCINLLKERSRLECASDIVFTHEPTKYGRAMIDAMRQDAEPRKNTLSLLFAADRNEHLFGKDGIYDCLWGGCRVVCDRYLFSSLAYQGGDFAERLNAGFPLPESLYFLEIGAEAAMERIAARGQADAFERLESLQKVQAEYERVIARYEGAPLGMRVMRINARLPAEQIAEIIWRDMC